MYSLKWTKMPSPELLCVSETSGGASGALNPDSAAADEHAYRYYEAIRNRASDSDVSAIAENIKWPKKVVKSVKQHIYLDRHDLGGGKTGRFEPDYNITQAWDRLIQGRHTELDIMLMKHELVELTQMKRHGYNYETAHLIANRYHNWQEAVQK